MEIGIDSFASAMYGSNALSSADAMEQLLDRIVRADEAGLNVFGIGEHHKKEFLDSAPAVILSAAAARTKQ
ncbi:MAG TPA: LLM class flavin-dependent oxidoreductase, partial [Cytophagaceae bacterium]